MPAIGEIKNVTSKISKSQLEANLNLSQVITSSVVSEFIKYAAGYLINELAGFWQGAAVCVGTAELIKAMELNEDVIKEKLNLIKANKGNGITVSQPMRYSYYSGSGTGWYDAGRPTITVY